MNLKSDSLHTLPLSFQIKPGTKFSQGKVSGKEQRAYDIYITDEEIVLSLREPTGGIDADIYKPISHVRLKISGINEKLRVVGLEELPGKVSYFRGNDPDKWHTGISTYAKVKYQEGLSRHRHDLLWRR